MSLNANHRLASQGWCPSAKRAIGIIVCLVVLLSFAFPSAVFAQSGGWCGNLNHPYGGPYDYLDHQSREKYLNVVERHHFTEDVRTLRKGATSYLIGDLEYVLNWFPNHHQALDALTRLAQREGTQRPARSSADVECRFKWAMDVNPNDAMVHVIRGLYYFRLGRHEDARDSLQQAADLQPDHPEVHYNLGLVLFRLKDYVASRQHAEQAYRLGYPLPGLRDMLEGVGHGLSGN